MRYVKSCGPKFLSLPLDRPPAPPHLPSLQLLEGERVAPASDLCSSCFSVMAGRGTWPTIFSAISSRRRSSSSTESECPWDRRVWPRDLSHGTPQRALQLWAEQPLRFRKRPFQSSVDPESFPVYLSPPSPPSFVLHTPLCVFAGS